MRSNYHNRFSHSHLIACEYIDKMNRRKQLKKLFDQLCRELELNNFNENFDYNKASLKLDFNSVYGGYRIDTIAGDGGTGEGFYIFSSRFQLGEMIALIQGIIHGLQTKKK